MFYLKGINKDLFIEDVMGKCYFVYKIFILFIKVMVDYFRGFLWKLNLLVIDFDVIKWVLIVFVIWSDVVKKFMC